MVIAERARYGHAMSGFTFQRDLKRCVQIVPFKTDYTATSVGFLLCCAILASCSSGQNAFFAQRDALISQGYKWEKLDKCRPAKIDTPAIPITVSDGRNLVCYALAPPQTGAATVSLSAANEIQTTLFNPTATTTTRAITHGTTPKTTTALPADPPADKSGIIWNFSNF